MSDPTSHYTHAIEAAVSAAAASDRAAAERALRDAIQSVEAMGPDDENLVIVLNDLVRLCLKQSSHALAEPLVLRLLELKRGKGEEHPEYVTVLASLAAVRQALGRHDDAEQLWRRVIAIREQTLAPNHFTLATAFEHLAEVFAARGKFADALHVSQRALAIREATLGREHASLRSSRERIADLELLAGEDSLDRGASPSGPHARPALIPGDGVGVSASRVLSEKPALLLHSEPVVAEQPAKSSSPPAQAPRRASPVPPPAALQRKSPPVPAPVKPEAYLSVLESLKDEIAIDEGTRAPATTSATRMTALMLFLRQPKVAAVVGVGAITLPLAAWGVAGAMRSSEVNWVDQKTVASAPLRPDTTHAGALAAGTGSTTGAADRRKDSVAAASKLAAARSAEASARPATIEPLIKLQGTMRLNIPLDSLRSRMSVPPVGSEPLMRLTDANDLAGSKAAPIGTPQRARMIGALPTPRYPAQQLRGGAGGSVRIRFDVDTAGRPVMSTFTVVSSPLPQLSAAVKEVIPGIRFEPARTPWPESKAVSETVELTFYFAPQAKQN